MSLAYAVAGGVVVIIAVVWLALRTSSSAARSAGRADAEAVAAQKVADDARTANAVRADVGAAGSDDIRKRLQQWTRD